MYIAEIALEVRAWILGFQDSFLSRIIPRYFALSVGVSSVPFSFGRLKEGILYFLENKTSSVLEGLTLKP